MDIKRFKAWAESKKLSTDGETGRNGSYTFYDSKTQYAWEATQAAKAQAVPYEPGSFKSSHEIIINETKSELIDGYDIAKEDEYLLESLVYRGVCIGKAQAVPEGFVLVPKELSDELADELASDAFNNIQSMFDYEHRGSTATHREQIRLRWCKNKAREFQENYKIVIEAQEQKG